MGLLRALDLVPVLVQIVGLGVAEDVRVAADENRLGRFIVTLRLVTSGATLAGVLAGGFLGEPLGVREALWGAAALSLTGILLLRPILAEHREKALR
ncbi:hypothetical protein [Salininema proteolyticum]|uniref:Transmembrane secretion effector n=1 Tax=Salininema proteolyticum TaxID=1607685 RepID=A0ABV8TZX4_9ACTN